ISFMVQNYNERMGSMPTLSEIAGALGESEEKISEAMGASAAAISLTAEGENGDSQVDIPIESSEEKITDRLSLLQSMEKLSEEEQKLIFLRYYKNKTQRETAELMGCSQVQISRKEKKILLYLRGALL
ncbi:MAG: sigma-70 family RNA polymerase sigma factor, partial [Oscillospiraceae bacterium]